MMEEIAKVESTYLGFEDHGLMSVNVSFNFGGSGQGTGHYMLQEPIKYSEFKQSDYDDDDIGTAWGMEFIKRLLQAFNVDEWGDIVGRTVYVLRSERFGMIKGIRPLPTEKGKEFIFTDLDFMLAQNEDSA